MKSKKTKTISKDKGSKISKAAKRAAALSAALPASFIKSYKDMEFAMKRLGDNQWAIDGEKVGGINEAMNAILKAAVGENNGRTADSFFARALREAKAPKKSKNAA